MTRATGPVDGEAPKARLDVVRELDGVWVALNGAANNPAGVGQALERLNDSARMLRDGGHTWTADRLFLLSRQLSQAPAEEQPSVLKTAQEFVLFVVSAALQGRLLSGGDGIRPF